MTDYGNRVPARDVFQLDGQEIRFEAGDTILQAVRRQGGYIPHLCWHPDYAPHGSCRVCTVEVDGRSAAACTLPAAVGLQVSSDTAGLNEQRKTLLQMLFIEGNHFCPSCEKSGNCLLQATAYQMQMLEPRFEEFYPSRPVDASHPDILLDFNRCILCELCVKASQLDGKQIFAVAGHGIGTRVVVDGESGRLGDTEMTLSDRAARICPVGVILPKRRGFVIPIGERRYDLGPVSDPDRQEAG